MTRYVTPCFIIYFVNISCQPRFFLTLRDYSRKLFWVAIRYADLPSLTALTGISWPHGRAPNPHGKLTY